MALRPTFEEQELLADTKRRADEPLVSRELACELIAAAGFLAAVGLAVGSGGARHVQAPTGRPLLRGPRDRHEGRVRDPIRLHRRDAARIRAALVRAARRARAPRRRRCARRLTPPGGPRGRRSPCPPAARRSATHGSRSAQRRCSSPPTRAPRSRPGAAGGRARRPDPRRRRGLGRADRGRARCEPGSAAARKLGLRDRHRAVGSRATRRRGHPPDHARRARAAAAAGAAGVLRARTGRADRQPVSSSAPPTAAPRSCSAT